MKDPQTDRPLLPAEINDPLNYSEGGLDRRLNKQVAILIRRTTHYIVYLDQDDCIEWWGVDNHVDSRLNDPKGCEIRTRCMNWEAILDTIGGHSGSPLSKPDEMRENLRPFRRQLAEVVAETLSVGGPESASKLLKEVEARITRVTEVLARQWLLQTAFLGSFFLAGGVIVAAILYYFHPWGFSRALVEIGLAGIMGGIGAVLSMLSRSSRLTTDFCSGQLVHEKEATARILTGVFGGIIVSLFLRSGLVLDSVYLHAEETRRLPLLLVLSSAAGTSERLVKSFLENVSKDSQPS